MADKLQVESLQKGVRFWNWWRVKNSEVRPNLSGANLSGMILNEINFSDTNLKGANLKGASLRWADLSKADLSGADLSQTNLSGVDFSGALLTRAILDHANLGWAKASNTFFLDVDLSQVEELDKITHLGPSHISIRTIYFSKGKIPFLFLRGVGVADNFIEYMHSLVGTTFEFYSCFISYAAKDQEFAKRVHADLQDNGVRCWFAPQDAKAGQSFINKSIRQSESMKKCC